MLRFIVLERQASLGQWNSGAEEAGTTFLMKGKSWPANSVRSPGRGVLTSGLDAEVDFAFRGMSDAITTKLNFRAAREERL